MVERRAAEEHLGRWPLPVEVGRGEGGGLVGVAGVGTSAGSVPPPSCCSPASAWPHRPARRVDKPGRALDTRPLVPPRDESPPIQAITRDAVEAALAGDRAAMTALVTSVLPPIKVEVGRCIGRQATLRRRDPRQDVDDFSHEVVLLLLRDDGRVLRLWDPARGPLGAFVRMLARQHVTRTLQGHRHNPWSDEPTADATLEPLVEHDPGDRVLESREELRGLLERLRAHLSERGLLLFQRLHVEQRPIAEVAAELGMTRPAVDAWLSRTRQLARRLASDAREGVGACR